MKNDFNKVPITFWIIAGVGLLWNILGLGSFLTDITASPESLADLDPALRNIFENTPIWTKILYGTATVTGSIGALLLVFRKKWAITLFLISLIAVLIQNIYWFFFTNIIDVLGINYALMQGMITIIGLFLWYYAKSSASKGWVN